MYCIVPVFIVSNMENIIILMIRVCVSEINFKELTPSI